MKISLTREPKDQTGLRIHIDVWTSMDSHSHYSDNPMHVESLKDVIRSALELLDEAALIHYNKLVAQKKRTRP